MSVTEPVRGSCLRGSRASWADAGDDLPRFDEQPPRDFDRRQMPA
jgi:phage terminase large subunit-like protein